MTAPAAVPLISIVLPVREVEEFLPACLDSVLGEQAGGKNPASGPAPTGKNPPSGPAPTGKIPPSGPAHIALEVIAVDDASRDGCGQILDDRAARDPRLRVIHLAASIGPGPARMRGLAEAAGT